MKLNIQNPRQLYAVFPHMVALLLTVATSFVGCKGDVTHMTTNNTQINITSAPVKAVQTVSCFIRWFG